MRSLFTGTTGTAYKWKVWELGPNEVFDLEANNFQSQVKVVLSSKINMADTYQGVNH